MSGKTSGKSCGNGTCDIKTNGDTAPPSTVDQKSGCACLNSGDKQSHSESKQKLIIDVDTGVDDAQAIMMTLAVTYEVDLLAVTCVAGNTNLEQACYNTMRILEVCGRTEVPLYKGAESGLMFSGVADDTAPHHGSDGMGGVPVTHPPDMSLVKHEHAVNAISRLAKENKDEITLVCLGPLTNIALALKMDPQLGTNLKNVVIMGGNIEGKGNITASAEFNFFKDPEAALIVLENLRCPIQLIAWEPCLNNGIEWEWYENQLSKVDTPLGKFHSKINAYSSKREKEDYKRAKYYTCDPLALAIATRPRSIVKSCEAYCTVSLQGVTRGQMVVDWNGQLERMPNVEVVTEVDIEEIKKLFLEMVC